MLKQLLVLFECRENAPWFFAEVCMITVCSKDKADWNVQVSKRLACLFIDVSHGAGYWKHHGDEALGARPWSLHAAHGTGQWSRIPTRSCQRHSRSPRLYETLSFEFLISLKWHEQAIIISLSSALMSLGKNDLPKTEWTATKQERSALYRWTKHTQQLLTSTFACSCQLYLWQPRHPSNFIRRVWSSGKSAHSRISQKKKMVLRSTSSMRHSTVPSEKMTQLPFLQGQHIYERGSKSGKRVQSNMVKNHLRFLSLSLQPKLPASCSQISDAIWNELV